MYQVILYYNFEPIEDPDRFCKAHKSFCKEIGLKGRIYISDEGINGTAGGTDQQIEEYKNYLWSLPGFDDTEFKQEESDYIPFAKLICKTRDEIVA
ncbi:MAG TPA: rhodanese domain-containing protein, partial [Balneolaceae bacterium]|nr:rhodanese domain-containing protein [Balneolaceae bacterium]